MTSDGAERRLGRRTARSSAPAPIRRADAARPSDRAPGSGPTWLRLQQRRARRRRRRLVAAPATLPAAASRACAAAASPGSLRDAEVQRRRRAPTPTHERRARPSSDRHHRTSVTPSNMSRRQVDAGRLQPFARLRPDAGGAEAADHLAVLRDARASRSRKISCIVMTSPSMPVISEMLVTLRVPSLMRDCWMTIWMADGDLLAHRALGQVRRAHRDHRLDSRQRVARRVGVDGRQRSVVAGVHRLQHVERFLAADLADDDAVGAHTQGVDRAAAAA